MRAVKKGNLAWLVPHPSKEGTSGQPLGYRCERKRGHRGLTGLFATGSAPPISSPSPAVAPRLRVVARLYASPEKELGVLHAR